MYTVNKIMKIFFKTLIIILFIAIPANSEIIKEIKVEGNKRISSETVKIFSEVELNQGDVVVQRGTNHAWSNRSNETCLIAFVLVDAVSKL